MRLTYLRANNLPNTVQASSSSGSVLSVAPPC